MRNVNFIFHFSRCVTYTIVWRCGD